MTVNKVMNTVGISLVVFGAAALLYSFHVRDTNASIQAAPAVTAENSAPPTVTGPTALQGNPVELQIPELGIDNVVIPGVFEEQTSRWTLTLDKVQHAVMTYPPNNVGGLTFMYGHNRKQVFSRLPSIAEGTIAEVKTDNGLLFRYKFTSSVVTRPEDISLFDYSGPPILVLQTCTGLFYQNRQLFRFELVEVVNV